MNKRKLYCKKDIIAIGQEGSISDYKNKLETCFNCYDFIFCEGSKAYLEGILKQKEVYKELNALYKKEG